MKAHVIRPGEDLSYLAARGGFDAEEVWDHDQNRDAREERDDPEVLAPGDVIYTPEPVEERCSVSVGAANRYRATVEKVAIDLVLAAGGSEPLANEPYEVRGVRPPITGQSDGEGKVTIEVPAHVREVELHLPNQGSSARLRIGQLDPATEEDGVRTRLANLGFLPPYHALPDWMVPARTRAQMDEELRAAVTAFQQRHGLDPTGELTQATIAALRREHGR